MGWRSRSLILLFTVTARALAFRPPFLGLLPMAASPAVRTAVVRPPAAGPGAAAGEAPDTSDPDSPVSPAPPLEMEPTPATRVALDSLATLGSE